ncbi:MAG: HK97 family phage prohead protease [Rickettsiales bacterium]
MITQQGNKIYGYASVFNVVDQQGDIILPGAFIDSIEQFEGGKKIILLWQHQYDQPVGVVDQMIEDAYGLYIQASITQSTQSGKEAFELIKHEVINGFSIGYEVNQVEYSDYNTTRYINNINLIEISLVTFPANQEAVITGY